MLRVARRKRRADIGGHAGVCSDAPSARDCPVPSRLIVLGDALCSVDPHWYTEKVHRLTAQDDLVYRRFARVMNLLDGPAALFHPAVVARVLYASVKPPARVQERPRSAANSSSTPL